MSTEYRVICDVCGFEYRASETRMRWDNARVCMKDWETRHPQDFVKARRDRQAVRNPRPVTPDVFIGGETLTDDDGLTPLQDDNYSELVGDA